MNITLHGTNFPINEELSAFVLQKIGSCKRAFGDMNMDPVQIAIELERVTLHHPEVQEAAYLCRAEANVFLPGRNIRVEETASTVEKAVVKLKHTLTRKIRKRRERLIASRRKGARKVKQGMAKPK